MPVFMLIVLGAFCLAGSAFLLGEAVTLPARERRSSVTRAANYGKVRAMLGQRQLPFSQRVLVPIGDRLAGFTLKLHPKTTTEGVSATRRSNAPFSRISRAASAKHWSA